jgi:predicted nucleic acid-binding protein
MDWVVDTCVLLDILDEISPFAEAAAETLDMKVEEGELTVAPITYVELAPAFNGDRSMQDLFLRNVGVNIDFDGNAAAVFAAHKAWYEHIMRKRSGVEKKRPIADVMIGAYAMRKGGLITRNEADFKTLYSDLTIFNPVSSESC